MPDILAAGGVVWRDIDGIAHVGLIVRNRYGGDLTLPKGKLERGETLKACALREVAEELGVHAELHEFLGATAYPMPNGDKYVMWWDMRWLGDVDDGPDGREVSSRRWLPPDEASAQLSYATDHEILSNAIALHQRR